MATTKHRRMPRPFTSILVPLVVLAVIVVSGVALAQTGYKTFETENRSYTTAEWRGASRGFGMVVRSDGNLHETTSIDWSDVPGMEAVIYNIHPNAPREQNLLITYSDLHRCVQDPAASVFCYVRVLVDGELATPENVVIDSVQHSANDASGGPYATHTAQFVAGPYGPGQHTVTVQWVVDEPDAAYQSLSRTISVMGFYSNRVTVISP